MVCFYYNNKTTTKEPHMNTTTTDRMTAAGFAAGRVDHYLALARLASDEQDMRAESEHRATARYWMKIWSSHWAA